MGYVRTGGMSTAARRRRRTTALVLTGLAILLFVVLAYAVAYYQGWVGGSDEGTTDSAQISTSAPSIQASEVTVNVYNAKGEPGLAGRIAAELEERDFDVDTIDNDPEQATIEHSADIRHGPEGLEAAEFMQQSVPGSKLLPDEREAATIDLVLGKEFEALSEAPADAAESTSEPASDDE